ncbi:cupin domain-containing protein [Brevundimonas sp.]|uniref:cupin domain-containing protein n=1 Tax=Brevundimonas sp. TaxID=1871086 RepID=UPI00272F2AB1|nr:cupin domain-containing protein [Brevundimonas sp.]MDP1914022.1 cupin domain-containing protein [Brevundimonas sp.]
MNEPLNWLLGEAADGFLTGAYERDPVIVHHGAPDRFRALLSIAAVDRKIAELDLREGMLSIADSSRSVELSDFVSDNGAIDRVAVARLYRRGATVILNQLHQSDIALAAFCRAVEQVFSCHVQTNIYLTPPGSQGFHTHYDNHDVFVLQIEGEKTWRLYDRPVASPYRGERFEADRHPVGEPVHGFVLKAGDCAYLPRGLMHDASASGDAASLHITCGLLVRTWADLMLEAISEVCVNDPAFRRGLPPGFANRDFDRTITRDRFRALVADLPAQARLDGALDLLTEQFIRSREPDVLGAVEGASRPPGGCYRARPSLWRLLDEDGGLRLIAPGGDLTFSRAPRAVIERALSGDPFTREDLGEDQAEELIRRLTVTGLIEPID